MKKIILLFTLLVAGTSLFAQDYGHCNFGELISQMPETKSSEQELQEYNKTLIDEGEKKAEALQAEYEAYQAARAGGDESPRQLAEREKKITAMQQALAAYEQEAQGKLNKKRNELLEPVINKANAAIEAVAKENGYKLIFDTSVFNAVLFAADSKDVMDLVKAKLGIE